MQDIIRKYSEEILEFYSQGLNYSQISRKLIEDFSLEISNMDSFRRAISTFINKAVESAPFQEISEELEKEESTFADRYQHEQSYYYDEIKDLYIVHIKNKPYRFTGTIVRDMKARYSNMDGSPETINEICRNFEIPRNIFVHIKTTFGWTHDSEPVTEEELMNKDLDEMVNDLLQKRKFSYYSGFF